MGTGHDWPLMLPMQCLLVSGGHLSRQSICFYFCLLLLFVAVCVSLVVVGFCFVCCVRFALSFVDSLFIEAYSLAQHHVAQP